MRIIIDRQSRGNHLFSEPLTGAYVVCIVMIDTSNDRKGGNVATKVKLPGMPKKTAIRKLIDMWAEGRNLNMIVRWPKECHIYIVPSRSDPGAYYIVAYDEDDDVWMCSCRGFRYNKKRDGCAHQDQIIEKEKEAARKWKGSVSKSSTTTKAKSSTNAVAVGTGSTPRKSPTKSRTKARSSASTNK